MDEPSVVAVVSEAVSLRASMRAVDVAFLTGSACALVAEEMARLEKASAALRAMAAARAADCGAHRAAGFDDADEWAARMTGESRQKARSELETGARMADCPKTKAAAADGELSLGQAEDITKTEQDKPGSEDELVDKAKSSTRQELSEACRQRRQEGVDPEALAARQRAKRSFRSFVDGDGLQCALLKMEPIAGLALLARIQVEADRRYRSARQERSTEPWEGHAADAVVAILEAGLGISVVVPHAESPDGSGVPAVKVSEVRKPTAPRRADVVIVVDLRTFRSGMHPDSLCHLIGGGPVPPSIVREMSRDAFLKVVFHDGVNIHTVTHVGRYRPAELNTALELGGPPEFKGVRCSVCAKRFRLQWDHVIPVCAGGVTSFENEDPKCWDCHTEKSRQEREAGVYGRRARRERMTSSAESGPDPPDDG